MKISKIIFVCPILIFLLLLIVSPVKLYAGHDDASTTWYKKHYMFTQNWFTDKIPTWTQILNEFKGNPDITYLEIGTFEGRSALWLLENILTHLTVTIADAFKENSYQTFISNISFSGEADKFKIMVGFSTEKQTSYL